MFCVGRKWKVLDLWGSFLCVIFVAGCNYSPATDSNAINNHHALSTSSLLPSGISASSSCPWNAQNVNFGSGSQIGLDQIQSSNPQAQTQSTSRVGQVTVGTSLTSSFGSGYGSGSGIGTGGGSGTIDHGGTNGGCGVTQGLPLQYFPQTGFDPDTFQPEQEPKILMVELPRETPAQTLYQGGDYKVIRNVNTSKAGKKFYSVVVNEAEDLEDLQAIEGAELFSVTQAWRFRAMSLVSFEATGVGEFSAEISKLSKAVYPSAPIYLGSHSSQTKHFFIIPRNVEERSRAELLGFGFELRDFVPDPWQDADLIHLASEQMVFSATFEEWDHWQAEAYLQSLGIAPANIQHSQSTNSIVFKADLIHLYDLLQAPEFFDNILATSPVRKPMPNAEDARQHFLQQLAAGGGGPGGPLDERPDPFSMARIDQANSALGREIKGEGYGVNVLDQAVQIDLENFVHPRAIEGRYHYTMGEGPSEPSDSEISHGNGVFGILAANGQDGTLSHGDGSYFYSQASFAYLDEFYEAGPVFDGLLDELESNSEFPVSVQNQSALSGNFIYSDTSSILDDIALKRDILLVAAAGNSVENPGELSERANAKNFLTVGGVDDASTPFDFSDDIYEFEEGLSFEFFTVCGEGYYSYGPTADGRMKPDLVYFGHAIKTLGTNGNDKCMTGTSASTALVSGQSAYLYQSWSEGDFSDSVDPVQSQQTELHPMTAKALLVNSAMQYNLPGDENQIPGISTIPRERQAWGLVDLPHLISKSDSYYIINRSKWISDGQTRAHVFTVEPDQEELRVTLSFFDPGGASIGNGSPVVNNIDLMLISPSGDRYLGNYGLLSDNPTRYSKLPPQTDLWDHADPINNIENVYLKTPEAGSWRVYVRATEINVGTNADQPDFLATNYSLVAMNAGVRIPSTGGCGVSHTIDIQNEPGVQVTDLKRRSLKFQAQRSTQSSDNFHQYIGPCLR